MSVGSWDGQAPANTSCREMLKVLNRLINGMKYFYGETNMSGSISRINIRGKISDIILPDNREAVESLLR